MASDKESSLLQVSRRRAGDSAVTSQRSTADGRTAIMPIDRRRKRKDHRRERRTNSRGDDDAYRLKTGTSQVYDAFTMESNIFLKLARSRLIGPGLPIVEKQVFFYGTGIQKDKAKPQR